MNLQAGKTMKDILKDFNWNRKRNDPFLVFKMWRGQKAQPSGKRENGPYTRLYTVKDWISFWKRLLTRIQKKNPTFLSLKEEGHRLGDVALPSRGLMCWLTLRGVTERVTGRSRA